MSRTKIANTTLALALLILIVVIRSFTLLPAGDVVHEGSSTVRRHQSPLEASFTRRQSPSNRTMVFVHVGKAAGETVKWRLKVSCDLRKSKRKKALCHELFHEHDESYMSKATIGYLHCNRLQPRGSIANATTYMISLRDPIDRIVSWYQEMHPLNCSPERPSAACNLKKGNNPWGLRFYEQCFPRVDDLFRSIQALNLSEASANTNDHNNNNNNCSDFALETIQGRGPEGASNHMFYNYQYYSNRTTFRYPEKDVVVVRQEMLWDDMRRIEGLLGGDPNYPFETQGKIDNHGSDKFLYRAKLDPSLVPPLCCFLSNEIIVYNNLLERALNLEPRHKEYSIKTLFSKCRVDSLQTLSSRCGWRPSELPSFGLV